MTDPPFDPEAFRGKPDEYLAWAERNLRPTPTMCLRHWMPCPVEGKPGLLVNIILMVEAFALMPPDVAAQGTDPAMAMNSWMANQTVPICCRLGDEKMSWLWWVVGLPTARLCCARYPQRGVSVRVCWRPAGHDGEHEWERLLRGEQSSVFDLMAELSPD